MDLNDEIGIFSKRREVEIVAKNHDVYEEDDYWDDEEYDDDSEYASLDFKMYKLDELNKFNSEIKEMEELIFPWWKNLKRILNETTLEKIDIIFYKKKSLLSDDTFEELQIKNIDDSLDELNTFAGILKKSYHRYFMCNIYGLIVYVPFIYWTGWNMWWCFPLAWSFFDMGLRYFRYKKQKEWLVKAETFIKAQNYNEKNLKIEESADNRLADMLAFNSYVSKQKNEHWNIKVYDAVANIFTRKK